jgi:curli production assembly/transport component CsgG
MRLWVLLTVLLVSGCASVPIMKPDAEKCTHDIVDVKTLIEKAIPYTCIEEAQEIRLPTHQELLLLPPAETMPVVAVYAFQDKTGQRKRRDGIADFSTATTQGGTELLIDALKTAGGGTWFRVVERAGIDNLVRERQIVRSARDEHKKQNPDDGEIKEGIQPLLFAGILLEGAIIGYDTNLESGGRGARYFGIGKQTQYRRDEVVVSIRGISTLTGEILLNVQAKKTILSYGAGFDVFRFVDLDTRLIEYEDGVAENESVTFATRAAIEAAVVALIRQGDERGFWVLQKQHLGENDE